MNYQLLNQEVLKTFGSWPEFIRFRCKCGNTWGIRLYPGQNLTDKDLTCSTCFLKQNYILKQKEE